MKRLRIIGLLVLITAGATSLMANPDYELIYTYYTDATLTTVCGHKYIMCSGISQSGCVTEWGTVDQGDECTDYSSCILVDGHWVCE